MNTSTYLEKKQIVAADLKIMCESLGLTSQWVADKAQMQLCTVQSWEAECMSVPLDVSAALEQIDSLVSKAMSGYIDSLINQYGHSIEVPLVRYRTDKELWKFMNEMNGLPLTTHAIYLSRLQDALQTKAIASFVGYIETTDYKKSLKKESRGDSELERALWVGRYYGILLFD